MEPLLDHVEQVYENDINNAVYINMCWWSYSKYIMHLYFNSAQGVIDENYNEFTVSSFKTWQDLFFKVMVYNICREYNSGAMFFLYIETEFT